MRHLLPLLLLAVLSCNTQGQGYTSYHTGSTEDATTSPTPGICLMGGATEDDNAMVWFLQHASGGDILVLRASGSDGYNDYLYSDLGVSVNSVESIVFNNITAASSSYVHEKIAQAEGIWFAGGDQFDYVTYFRDTPIRNLLNEAITERQIVIGGTSAGMAIMGQYYFSAENGTVTSDQALANPFHNNITVDSTEFLNNTHLENVVTDTHYDNPDRKGRHVVFMSRMLSDYGISAKGIACEEYVSVCVDASGIASVYGEYPNYDDFAYFLQTNCELDDNTPETCEQGTALTWDLNGEAIKVYKVPGTTSGTNHLDLTNWTEGEGGEWQDWHVIDGELYESSSYQPDCIYSIKQPKHTELSLYPNPASEFIIVEFDDESYPSAIEIFNTSGSLVYEKRLNRNSPLRIENSQFSSGLHSIVITYEDGHKTAEKLLIQD